MKCKRKVHVRNELIHAQELGELLAVGCHRHSLKRWTERDREVTMESLPPLTYLRPLISVCTMTDCILLVSNFLIGTSSGFQLESSLRESSL